MPEIYIVYAFITGITIMQTLAFAIAWETIMPRSKDGQSSKNIIGTVS